VTSPSISSFCSTAIGIAPLIRKDAGTRRAPAVDLSF
jgi:hypothetical protein